MEEIIAQDSDRLDKYLQNHLKKPRNQIENFIKEIGVTIDGKKINKCGYKLKVGEKIQYSFPKKKRDFPKEIDFDIDIIYEDEDILVINKPPHLVVHPAPSVKEPTLVDWLKHKGISLSTLSGEERHGIVHRIDKETSGALVIAKNNDAHTILSQQLEDRTMGRYYLAIIDLPLKEDIIVNKAIARDRNYRTRMAIDHNGKDAKSAFIKLGTNTINNTELIACKLFSGRTHQIRVHLKSLSRHIIGDLLYGFKSKKDRLTRVMLHAKFIYFKHPRSGKLMSFKAPLFDDFNTILQKNFSKETIDEKLDLDYLINRFDTLS